ncbi:MAG: hypothetical protein ONA69_09095 [candidate division KSB1 bacterium]|nr:hypothetical protein [candidate division KSB1 bacterium]MDZ7346932.1 hypothetical protein [candidate division KSB1 bacterium]
MNKGMSLIVKTVTRLTIWIILLYGIYIILHGHLTPGGGFAGGVVIALALLNVTLAYGREFVEKWLRLPIVEHVESVCSLAYLLIGILGILWGGAFFVNFLSKGELFHLISAGTLPILNIIIGLKVAVSLFLVVWVIAAVRVSKGESA